jgi:hypothetical protein
MILLNDVVEILDLPDFDRGAVIFIVTIPNTKPPALLEESQCLTYAGDLPVCVDRSMHREGALPWLNGKSSIRIAQKIATNCAALSDLSSGLVAPLSRRLTPMSKWSERLLRIRKQRLRVWETCLTGNK